MIQFEEHILQLGWFNHQLVEKEVWNWSSWGFSVWILCSTKDFDWLNCVLSMCRCDVRKGWSWLFLVEIQSYPLCMNSWTTQTVWQNQFQQAGFTWFPTPLFFFPSRFHNFYRHITYLLFFSLKLGTPRGISSLSHRHLLFGLHQTRSSGVCKSMVSMHARYMERYIPTNERKLMDPSKEQVALVRGSFFWWEKCWEFGVRCFRPFLIGALLPLAVDFGPWVFLYHLEVVKMASLTSFFDEVGCHCTQDA